MFGVVWTYPILNRRSFVSRCSEYPAETYTTSIAYNVYARLHNCFHQLTIASSIQPINVERSGCGMTRPSLLTTLKAMIERCVRYQNDIETAINCTVHFFILVEFLVV